jgi:hypothetical protein
MIISNYSTGKDLKDRYMKENGISNEKHNIRLLNRGHEIKDEHKLFTHKISADSNIQVLIKPVEI